MIGIYHSKDLDGIASAAILKRKFPDIILHPFDNGEKLDLSIYESEQPVIMVDIALPTYRDMLDVHNWSKWDFTWIDHHKSSIDKFNAEIADDYALNRFKEHTRVGTAACELCWEYFFPEEPLPKAIRLLSKYDVWNKDREWPNVMAFQFGVRAICKSPDTFPKYLFEEDPFIDIDILIIDGKLILDYQKIQDERLCHSSAFERNFEGYRLLCLTGCGVGSNTFKTAYNPDKHDLLCSFYYNGSYWKYSLYCMDDKDIDASLVAIKYGGGGHKKACGFETKEFLLK